MSERTCFACNKKGHYSSNCPDAKARVRAIEAMGFYAIAEYKSDSDDSHYEVSSYSEFDYETDDLSLDGLSIYSSDDEV